MPDTFQKNPATATKELLLKQLDRERRARLDAERLLETRSAELYKVLKNLNDEIAFSRQLFESVEATTDGILIVDADGKIIYSNQSNARLFEYETADLIGQDWNVLFTREEYSRFLKANANNFLQNQQWQGEIRGVSSTGKTVHVDVAFKLMQDGRIICSGRDISDRLNKEQERRSMAMELHTSEQNALVVAVANSLAHDFNNLIAAITGYALLLQADLDPDSEEFTRAARIGEAADQASGVLQQIENLRHNKAEVPEPIDLVERLEASLRILDSIRPTYTHIAVDFPQAANAELAPILFSRGIINIVRNAFEADATEITLKLTETPSQPLSDNALMTSYGDDSDTAAWYLEITDNGEGMSQSAISNIFSAFFSTKSGQTGGGGSGLGLQSVCEFADLHNTCVEVESVPGKGSRFRLHIPGTTEVPALPEYFIPDLEDPQEQYKVLVVDDNPLVGDMLEKTLHNLGHTVRWIASPLRALDELTDSGTSWDILLTDLTMPEMNGKQLARNVRQLKPNLPIIIYSGQASFIQPDPVFSAILRKPIKPEDLQDALQSALHNRV